MLDPLRFVRRASGLWLPGPLGVYSMGRFAVCPDGVCCARTPPETPIYCEDFGLVQDGCFAVAISGSSVTTMDGGSINQSFHMTYGGGMRAVYASCDSDNEDLQSCFSADIQCFQNNGWVRVSLTIATGMALCATGSSLCWHATEYAVFESEWLDSVAFPITLSEVGGAGTAVITEPVGDCSVYDLTWDNACRQWAYPVVGGSTPLGEFRRYEYQYCPGCAPDKITIAFADAFDVSEFLKVSAILTGKSSWFLAKEPSDLELSGSHTLCRLLCNAWVTAIPTTNGHVWILLHMDPTWSLLGPEGRAWRWVLQIGYAWGGTQNLANWYVGAMRRWVTETGCATDFQFDLIFADTQFNTTITGTIAEDAICDLASPEDEDCIALEPPVIPEDPTTPDGTCGMCQPDGETPVNAPRIWQVTIVDSDITTVDGASINGGPYPVCLVSDAADPVGCIWRGYISCKTHGGETHTTSKCFLLEVEHDLYTNPFYAQYTVRVYDNVGNVLDTFIGEDTENTLFDCDDMPTGYSQADDGYCGLVRDDTQPDVCFCNPDAYPWGPDVGLPVQNGENDGFYLSHEANPPATEDGEYQTVCGGCQPTELYLTPSGFTDESDDGDCGSKVGPTAATLNGNTFALQKIILPATYVDPAFATGCQYDFLSQIEAPFLIGGNAAVYIYQEQDEEENYLDWALVAYIHRKYDAAILTIGVWLMVRSGTALWDTLWYYERQLGTGEISCMTIDEALGHTTYPADWFTINEDYEESLCAGIAEYDAGPPEVPATSIQFESGETCWCEDE